MVLCKCLWTRPVCLLWWISCTTSEQAEPVPAACSANNPAWCDGSHPPVDGYAAGEAAGTNAQLACIHQHVLLCAKLSLF